MEGLEPSIILPYKGSAVATVPHQHFIWANSQNRTDDFHITKMALFSLLVCSKNNSPNLSTSSLLHFFIIKTFYYKSHKKGGIIFSTTKKGCVTRFELAGSFSGFRFTAWTDTNYRLYTPYLSFLTFYFNISNFKETRLFLCWGRSGSRTHELLVNSQVMNQPISTSMNNIKRKGARDN